MAVTVFSSTGCIRCSIVKQYLKDNNIDFTEHDIKTDEGNAIFKTFYKENRNNVLRDSGGIFFPVVQTESGIVQDAGASLDWFLTKRALAKAIEPNNLGHGWIGKINVSQVPSEHFDVFCEILSRMKDGGLQIAINASGLNASLLERILKEKLVHKLNFNIDASQFLENNDAFITEFKASVHATALYAQNIKYKFFIDIAPKESIVAKEVFTKIAQLMKDATNNNRLPVLLTNIFQVNANIYAYKQAMGEYQILTDLKTRLY